MLIQPACVVIQSMQHPRISSSWPHPKPHKKKSSHRLQDIFLQLAIVTKSPAYTAYTAYTWTILMESYGYDPSIKCLGIRPSGCNPSRIPFLTL